MNQLIIPTTAIALLVVSTFMTKCEKRTASRTPPDFLLTVEDSTPEMWTSEVYP